MPATAVTRPPPTDGPRLRNLRLLSESALGAAAVASGFADSGRAPPRRRPWAAAGSATQTASITLRKATRRWERRSIAASCSKRAAGERGTGSILHGDETSTRASRAGDPSCYEWERPRVGRDPGDARRPHKAHNSRQLPGLAFLRPSRTIKEFVGPQGGSMPDMIRQVDYYYTMAPDKAGEGARLLGALRNAGVNLLAFSAFPSARKSQADFVPADGGAFVAGAKHAKIKVKGAKKCFLIEGDDRVGALYHTMTRLGDAKINVTAVDAVTSGMGRWAAILWVKQRDVKKAAQILGAM